jgi:hypothetical protein
MRAFFRIFSTAYPASLTGSTVYCCVCWGVRVFVSERESERQVLLTRSDWRSVNTTPCRATLPLFDRERVGSLTINKVTCRFVQLPCMWEEEEVLNKKGYP